MLVGTDGRDGGCGREPPTTAYGDGEPHKEEALLGD